MAGSRRHARAVLVAVVAALVMSTTTAFAGGPVPPVAGSSVRLSVPSTVSAGTSVAVSVVASSGPIALRDVDVVVSGVPTTGAAVVLARGRTDSRGAAALRVRLPSYGDWLVRATVVAPDGPSSSDSVAVSAAPLPAALALAVSARRAVRGVPVTVTPTLSVSGRPTRGVRVTLYAGDTVVARATTDRHGRATVLLAPTSAPLAQLWATADGSPLWRSSRSRTVALPVLPADVSVAIASSRTVRAGRRTSVSAVVRDNRGHALRGVAVTLHAIPDGHARDVELGTAITSRTGRVLFTPRIPGTARLYAFVPASSQTQAGLSKVVPLTATGVSTLGWGDRPVSSIPPVELPGDAPLPTVQAPAAPAPVGSGAHPVVSSVPDAVWSRMQGNTWHDGCLARSSLRYITVNYWGFDGLRHRGELVMAASAADSAASALERLYSLGFPIRSMVTEDAFGPNPRGPGADDYASMAADNTSGFNCRYVVGLEAQHVVSPHALGIAIDINPWENPYVARTGTFPDSWWVSRSRPGSEVLRSGSSAVAALAAEGFAWGASFKDTQHFQR